MSGVPQHENPRIFDCNPKILAPGDIVVLTKALPELKELAIHRPGTETSHFLVVESPPPEMQPLLSTRDLEYLERVEINVSDLVGLEWRVDASSEPVFTVPGVYTFILSTVLESEEPAYACKVQYRVPHAR
jgi:hypothetical protein